MKENESRTPNHESRLHRATELPSDRASSLSARGAPPPPPAPTRLARSPRPQALLPNSEPRLFHLTAALTFSAHALASASTDDSFSVSTRRSRISTRPFTI